MKTLASSLCFNIICWNYYIFVWFIKFPYIFVGSSILFQKWINQIKKRALKIVIFFPKNWSIVRKQPKCPWTDEWMKEMQCVCIYNGILLSHKMNEIMPFAATQINLEIITLSWNEVRQRETYDIPYLWNLKKKMTQMNLFTKQKQTHRHRTLMVTKGEKGRDIRS